MGQLKHHILIGLPILFILWASSCQQGGSRQLKIAVSANASFALEDMVRQYEDSTGHQIALIVGSSGQLFAMIRSGAEFDLFLSADSIYPHSLYDQGFAKQQPRVYGYGHLVLWWLGDSPPPSIDAIPWDSIDHLAMARPEIAPYGKAALEALNAGGMDELMEHKMVYGQSISHVNSFVLSGAADLGVTSMSSVLSKQAKGKGRWTLIPESSHSPITQSVVLLNTENPHPLADSFYNYLFSPEATAILEAYGYRTTPSDGG